MQVAVLGTGIMGTGMAQSLVRAGHEVRVWNRTRERAEPLAEHGATVADSAREAVEGADAVVTILFDADAVLTVMDGLGLPDGCVWLQSSTIGLDGTRRVVELARDRGWTVLDAPVVGTRAPAAEGRLVVLVSGDEQAASRMRPLFDAIGHKTVDAGAEPGTASALKLVCNAWIGTLTAALGQSVALAEGLGLDPRLFLDTIDGGPVDMPYVHVKGAAMLSGEYPPSFTVDNVLKDLGLIGEAADHAQVADALLAGAREMFARASADGQGAADMAAVRLAYGTSQRGA